MASTRDSLVLGAATRLAPSAFLPFATSLRRTGYQGRLVLFTHGYDAAAEAQLAALADSVERVGSDLHPPAHLITRSLAFVRATRRVRRAYPLAFKISSRLSSRGRHGRHGSLELHLEGLQSLRYNVYREYLLNEGKGADLVLITDVRDVIFQGDPFDKAVDGLEVFLEDASRRIASEPFNRRWTLDLYGAESLKRYGRSIISCSGTVLGTRLAMIEYLTLMADEIGRHNRPMGSHDQGVHNHLVYGGYLPQARFGPNGVSRVLTAGGLPELPVGSDGLVYNEDGTVPPVVHQYDRFPEAARSLQLRLAGVTY